MSKEKLEKIIKINCEMCNEVTPHRYIGKVEAETIYHLYICLYCHHKYQSKEKKNE